MIYVGFIFHAYQPPTQSKDVLDKITKECYSWIFDWIAKSDIKVNLNLSASLIEPFVRYQSEERYKKVLENIVNAAKKGSIEFVGSAAYHPILPKLPEDEIKRQIELNNKINKKVFKELWSPKGFYPPEFAFAPSIANNVKEAGFKWVLASERSYTAKNKTHHPFNSFITVKGLPVVLRSDKWSDEINFIRPSKGNLNLENYVNDLCTDLSKFKTDNYIIVGGDIETFGHHIHYTEDSLETIVHTIKKKRINNAYITELLEKFPKREDCEVYPGSQSTNEDDYANREFFPFWDNSRNPIHKKQWELTYCAIDYIKNANILTKKSKNSLAKKVYREARDVLDKGLYSCQYWWANPLGNWNPGMICEGAKKLYEAIVASKKCIEILSNSKQSKKSKKDETEIGQRLYFELIEMVSKENRSKQL